jgi:2-dehydro-3-deoxyphosphogluconate aldolase/(4S)-4-hydroxy-2-oxoglutarate aldolase
MKIREIMGLAPVIPVLTVEAVEHAAPLARALVAGGLRVLEVTLRTDAALEAIRAMRKAAPEAIVGVGTLTRPEDFARAAAVGAQFGVTPGLTPELIAAARQTAFPLLPGIMSPTELIAARLAGFDALKFFPAEPAGGVSMLSAFAGPFSDVLFCPTGGITARAHPGICNWPTWLAWADPGSRRRRRCATATGPTSRNWPAMLPRSDAAPPDEPGLGGRALNSVAPIRAITP